MKPCATCPAGRADTAESAPSRPLRSIAWTPRYHPVQLTTPTLTYRQTQLVCPSRSSLSPLCLCAARARSLCCCVEPSPPSLSPCAGPHCPHAMCGYKRRPLPFILSVPPPLPSSDKPPLPRLTSVPAAPSVPTCLTRLPSSCASSGAPTHLRKASQSVAGFPDHRSRPTLPPRIGEIHHHVVVLL
jgi:hypothetical protein